MQLLDAAMDFPDLLLIYAIKIITVANYANCSNLQMIEK